MSHFVAYILQFQEIIVYKIPPGGGGRESIASLRSRRKPLPDSFETYISHSLANKDRQNNFFLAFQLK